MRRISKFVMWLAVAVGIQTGFAQVTDPPVSIDSADVRSITEGAAVAVEHNYVFADRAGEIAKVVRPHVEGIVVGERRTGTPAQFSLKLVRYPAGVKISLKRLPAPPLEAAVYQSRPSQVHLSRE